MMHKLSLLLILLILFSCVEKPGSEVVEGGQGRVDIKNLNSNLFMEIDLAQATKAFEIELANLGGLSLDFKSITLVDQLGIFTIVQSHCSLAQRLQSGQTCRLEIEATSEIKRSHWLKFIVEYDNGVELETFEKTFNYSIGKISKVELENTDDLDFGAQELSTYQEKILTFKNTGDFDLTISLPDVVNTRLNIASTNCVGHLASMQTCQATVFFQTDNQIEQVSRLITLNYSSINHSGSAFYTLIGLSTEIKGILRIITSPSFLNFGSTGIGNDNFKRTFRLQNTGYAPLTIKNLNFNGRFEVKSIPQCLAVDSTLQINEICDFELFFNPDNNTTFSETHVITYDNHRNPAFDSTNFTTSGQGLIPVDLPNHDISFTDSIYNETYEINLTIENNGQTSINFLTDSFDRDFFTVNRLKTTCPVDINTFKLPLYADGSCSLSLLFSIPHDLTPATFPDTKSFVITYSNQTGVDKTMSVNIHTQNQPQTLALIRTINSSSSLDFGNIYYQRPLNTISPKFIQVENYGAASGLLSVQDFPALIIVDSTSTCFDFSNTGNNFAKNLSAGESCVIEFKVDSSSIGFYNLESFYLKYFNGANVQSLHLLEKLNLMFKQVAVNIDWPGTPFAIDNIYIIDRTGQPLAFNATHKDIITLQNKSDTFNYNLCSISKNITGSDSVVDFNFLTSINSCNYVIAANSTHNLSFEIQHDDPDGSVSVDDLNKNLELDINYLNLQDVLSSTVFNDKFEYEYRFQDASHLDISITNQNATYVQGSIPSANIVLNIENNGSLDEDDLLINVPISNFNTPNVNCTNILSFRNLNDEYDDQYFCSNTYFFQNAFLNDPQNIGLHNYNVEISGNNTIHGVKNIPFSLNILRKATLTQHPQNWSCYTFPTQSASSFNLSFRNNGSTGQVSSAVIDSVQLLNGNGEFSIVGDNCSSKTLTANKSCSLNVLFNPQTTGNKEATVRIVYKDGRKFSGIDQTSQVEFKFRAQVGGGAPYNCSTP
jgi:hypothetical protein